MANARKVQAEADRTLKTIGEHLIEFDSIWEKVMTANTSALKEKYEGDLKKEIKKLQRMRDTLKTYIQCNEIKMKKPLSDARKCIEGKMEQFKVLERETKTKAYSREGLNQASKRLRAENDENNDQDDEEKREAINEWIDACIEGLQQQMDEAENMREKGTSNSNKNNKKKKGFTSETMMGDDAQRSIERHAWHIARLNQIREALDRDLLELETIEECKESVDDYITNNAEPDFNEDEGVYDGLQLDEIMASIKEEPEGSDENDEAAPATKATSGPASSPEAEEEPLSPKTTVSAVAATPNPVAPASKPSTPAPKVSVAKTAPSTSKAVPSPATPVSVPTTSKSISSPSAAPTLASVVASPPPVSFSAAAAAASSVPSHLAVTSTAPSPSVSASSSPSAAAVVAAFVPAASPALSVTPSILKKPLPLVSSTVPAVANNVPAVTAPVPIKPMESLASIVMKSKANTAPATAIASLQPAVKSAASNAPPVSTTLSMPLLAAATQAQPKAAISVHSPPLGAATSGVVRQASPLVKAIMSPAANMASPSNATNASAFQQLSANANLASASSTTPSVTSSSLPVSRPASNASSLSSLDGIASPTAPSPSPLQSVFSNLSINTPASTISTFNRDAPLTYEQPAPALKERERAVFSENYFYTLSMIDVSRKFFPQLEDTERVKTYTPRNPHMTPSFFPSTPIPLFEEPRSFEKLSIDTLFFIFYFQQGTPHQYLAARELKKQSWRYHKNFLTWFQRHEDPKVSTEEYEQGTYVYFDYDSGWCQRIKQDFTFEYRHLEEEEEGRRDNLYAANENNSNQQVISQEKNMYR